MASTRQTVVAFKTREVNFHEAIARGTGCDGTVGRRVCARYDSGLAVGASSVGVGVRSGEIRNDQEGQEEEGEKDDEFFQLERCVADEVNKQNLSCPKPDHRGSKMNKLLIALIAGAFATVAAAQTAMPGQSPTSKEKQADVKGATAGNPNNSAGQAATAAEQKANTAKSKDVSKMTAAEKNAYAKEVNKSGVNPENPSGSTTDTAAQQKANTAESKATPKQNTDLKGKEGQKTLEKDLQKKSTGQ